MLKIRVMNISKNELGKTLKKFKGTAWDQSPLFKKIYEEEYGQFGGEPYGCLVGDYYFDHSPPDVELLGEMAKVARPRMRRSSPALARPDADGELAGAANPRDLTKIFGTARVRAWRSLRESRTRATSAWPCRASWRACPTAPRPTRSRSLRLRGGHRRRRPRQVHLVNAAYAMAVNINRSFKLYGWCSRIRGIESGGAVEGLPVHTFPTDDGGVDMKCPTEIAITDRREAELAKNGFMPLMHKKNTDFAAFIGAQSLQKPPSTTTRTPPPTPTWRRGCPTCSPPAASPTT
jgi:type VI secretion system protein ImpC